MKRVALITVSVHGDPSADGAQEAGEQNVYVREVARSLAARGLGVDVFTRSSEGGLVRTTELAQQARLIQVPCGPAGQVPRSALFAMLPTFVQGVADWVERDGARYLAVHSNYWLSGWAGMRLASMWGVPQTHTFHSLGKIKYQAVGNVPTIGKVRIAVEEVIASSVAALIATSDDEAHKLRRLYGALAPICVIPGGHDFEVFRSLGGGAFRGTFGWARVAAGLERHYASLSTAGALG